ncbi:methyl-accepting chemotaxis protein [Reinekea marinisedimentorum]|uniref:Methyl-accepting chemotaxis protein n=1 Tax=Reinekea marinisedimentorum TaxID=230495 RepID=A0A4R3I5J7_9GAMM|nr:methyl-accepting chemotaxis protein [Reinekea marinisedimentorum]TCS41134.1 methyl-accepting chemotaxis protein [Reinekea marinisedimentorum]
MKLNKKNKIQFSVAAKLVIGFATVLLLLAFIAFQSIGNYRQTQRTLDHLVSISEQMLQETTVVQTTLLNLVSDFKRVAEQNDTDAVNRIIETVFVQKSQVIDAIDAVAAYIDDNPYVQFTTSAEVRQMNEQVEQVWKQMEASAQLKLQQFQVDDEVRALGQAMKETEQTLKPYFEDLFWEAYDDQQLIVLYEFYSSFLIGLNVAKDVEIASDLTSINSSTLAYQDWQSSHLEYFLSMTSLVAQNEAFQEASVLLDQMTRKMDALVQGADGAEGLLSRRAQSVGLALQAAENIKQVDSAIESTLDAVADLNDSATVFSQEIAADMQRSVDRAVALLIVTSLLAAAAAVVISLLVLRSIRNPMKLVIDALRHLSAGDLTFRINRHSSDEFGELSRATEQVNNRLTDMIGNIVSRSNRLNDISHSTMTRTESALQRVASQAEELGSIATSMQEMTYTVSEVANSAGGTREEVNRVNDLSASADQDMQVSKQGISELRGHLESAVSEIGEMNGAVENIEKILVVIRSIADQTNLLALNAAIEAARAGEHGRGFAVVADEVRSLANRTQDSTSEINGIIEGLNVAVTKAVSVIEQGSQMANESDERFDSLTHTLTELNSSIEKLGSSSDHIASIASDQSATADAINKQLVAISDSAEGTREEVNEVAGSIAEVGNVSDSLRDMISVFKLENDSKTTTN